MHQQRSIYSLKRDAKQEKKKKKEKKHSQAEQLKYTVVRKHPLDHGQIKHGALHCATEQIL